MNYSKFFITFSVRNGVCPLIINCNIYCLLRVSVLFIYLPLAKAYSEFCMFDLQDHNLATKYKICRIGNKEDTPKEIFVYKQCVAYIEIAVIIIFKAVN